MKNILVIIATTLIIATFVGFFAGTRYFYIAQSIVDTTKMVAGAFFTESVNATDIQKRYKRAFFGGSKVKVLIVPGHEPDFGGTSFNGIFERDLNVDLSEELAHFLGKNRRYEVVVARTKEAWHPDLQSYFESEWNEIDEFRTEQKKLMAQLIKEGKIERKTDGVYHNNAPLDAAMRLFGINKWANEQEVDITVHIHFNDIYRPNSRIEAPYSGFSIYVPEKQYSNAKASREIADAIFKRLAFFFPISDVSKESVGVVEDQDLIAVGQSNTADAVSMLIEYSYIYEPHLQNKNIREPIIKEMALQTYLGLQDFFKGVNDTEYQYYTTLLPYVWNEELSKGIVDDVQVLSLQTALMFQGHYPPFGSRKNECPLSGNAGTCTIKALQSFQEKHAIENEEGKLGEKTREALNNLYGSY